MKKVLAITFAVIIGLIVYDYLYFCEGVLYIPYDGDVVYNSKVEGERLYVDSGNGFEEIEIKGVNMGLSKPGYYATENGVTKEEYLTWFKQIQDMGANVIRVYNVASVEFYDAFYEYNIENDTPLYLMQSVAINDYLMNSIYRALDDEFYDPFLENCKIAVDVVHGRYKASNKESFFPFHYDKDVSQWVYGYILGSEWENSFVTYTNNSYNQLPQYDGEYLFTENASNFEIFLAEIGDQVIDYEMKKYGTQKTISFTNWALTDPLEHEEIVKKYFRKAACVNVENIKSKESFLAGQFASYHVYPAYPDFYKLLEVHEKNTYFQYLKDLNAHHTMPVVIAEFGASSSRALSSEDKVFHRDQGRLSESEQGAAIVSMYEDIMAAGGNGGIIAQWQDEWYKKTWNTMASVNLDSIVYWGDVQSCAQNYGLLSFDPGDTESICYVDGQKSEWQEEDLVSNQNNIRLYMKYDEKYIYFMVEKKDYDVVKEKLYIPIDITPKSGSKKIKTLGITASEDADFVIEINGKENSRLWVHERYDTLSALFFEEISAHNFFSKEFPEVNSTEFVKINLLMQNELYFELTDLASPGSLNDKPLSFAEYNIENPYHYMITEYYETGNLTYGNANPDSEVFNSLADFCAGRDCVEIKLPWQLLNFADPVNMYIHDDYYKNYGVEYLKIDKISVGAGIGVGLIKMEDFSLKPLGKEPSYHERLKESYYIIKGYWGK